MNGNALQELASMSRDQRALRSLIVIGALLLGGCAALAGDAGLGNMVLVAAVGLLSAALPHTVIPTVATVSLIGFWGVQVSAVDSPLVIPAAWGLLLFHTAAGLAAVIPGGAPAPRAVWVTYAKRLGIVSLAPIAAWLAMLGISTLSVDSWIAPVVGLALIATILGAHFQVVRRWRERTVTNRVAG